MKSLKAIFLTGILALSLAACSKVPAGNVGVKVYLLGTSKGVDTEELGPGRYWIGYNEDLYLFPTFTQNYVWTRTVSEGSREDESITFQTTEGLSVNADVGISYHIAPDRVSDIFQKYRKGVNEITDIYLRNMVRDALVIESSKLPMEMVYGAGKAELIDAVEKSVREQVGPIGIEVEKIYWIGDLRLPQTVIAALNAKIEATQKAQQRRNEVEQAKAEADKRIESARGERESQILIAQGEAEAIRIKGDALRKNPELLQLSAIEQWDGVLPRITSDGVVPFINIDNMSK